MAYADARHTQRTVGTVALVAVLEVALGVGIVAGLAFNGTRDPPRPPVSTFDVPPPQIDKPIDPPPIPDTKYVPQRPPVAQDPVFDLGPAPQPSFAPDDTTAGDDGLGTVAFPTPTPSPVPSFTPLKAKPRGNPANWVTPNDYPTSEIRAEHQGRTSFRLSLDPAGKVTNCAITTSSGWPVLDAVTCEKLARRAKFEAAIDNTGAKTAGSYAGTVNWRLPEE
jgi:periplasmic protein TonB